jgi:hypothetical protein
LHEGWNYHKWEEAKDFPKYRFYRFATKDTSKINGGCLINEITFTGTEVIDSIDNTYDCPA